MSQHHLTVSGIGPFKPLCTCGWIGTSTANRVDAWTEANAHDRSNALLSPEEGQRLLLLRDNCRTLSGAPSWLDVDFMLQLFDRARKRIGP